METHSTHSLFDRRPIAKCRNPAVKWVKEWVPQELVSTGGKCLVLKWVNESTLKAVKENPREPEVVEPEPEPTTEVLFLCSFEGCGKTFIDAGALRKHSHIHGERQYVCHYENCGKKFLDSSKLKRHFLIHTGERHFVCPHEGCGKAFSLDFNLRSHMKTHSQENYHVCPHPDCGKRYAHEYKLKNHIASHHEKQNMVDAPKYTPPPPEKTIQAPRVPTGLSGPATPDRPYACPYQGCEKAYIHEYKLNLHLRREHPTHFPQENSNKNNNQQTNNGNEVDGNISDQEAGKLKVQKQNRAKPNIKLPPSKAKVHQRKSSAAAANLNVVKKAWQPKEEMYEEEEDSEETEEERDNVGDGWRYGENNEEDDDDDDDDDDDEETEYED
ncbi:Transcriptional repressor protein yy1 [Orobanche gracilis]